jgi:sugar O-acyltransferase (sialic acid O-acetyltransferase NeuD family)
LAKSDSIVIIGFGGHAKSCLDVAKSLGKRVPFLVGIPDCPREVGGIRVFQPEEALSELRATGVDQVFVAVGENYIRQELFEFWTQNGFHMPALISPYAQVSSSAVITDGTVVMPNSFVGPSAQVDIGSIVNTSSVVEHDCKVGQFAHVAPNACLLGGVEIGERVLVGAGSVVLPKVVITNSVTVGAGSVVITNIENPGTYVGTPVRKVNA